MFRKVTILLLLLSMFTATSDARFLRRCFGRITSVRILRCNRTTNTSTNTNVSTTVRVNVGGSDQARAQHKANLMASRGRLSHGIAPLCATFEGIGMGGSRNCGTCTPRRGMTLTADAAAYGNGRWYRVRGWR